MSSTLSLSNSIEIERECFGRDSQNFQHKIEIRSHLIVDGFAFDVGGRVVCLVPEKGVGWVPWRALAAASAAPSTHRPRLTAAVCCCCSCRSCRSGEVEGRPVMDAAPTPVQVIVAVVGVTTPADKQTPVSDLLTISIYSDRHRQSYSSVVNTSQRRFLRV